MPLVLKITVDDQGVAHLETLGKSVDKLKEKTRTFGEIFKGVLAANVVQQGIGYLITGLHSAANEAIQFELAMKRIQGIGGVTGKALQDIGEQAITMSKQTEFSASQISNAMLEVVKMGFDSNDAAKVMPEILNLSTAAMADLSWSANNTIATLRAFNLGNDEVGRVANVVATALNVSALNLEDYMEAMKYIAPISTSLNVSLEETSAMMAALADAGIKGSLAGTTLKNILLNLLQPSKEVGKALETMHLKGMSVVDILKGLKDRGMTVVDFLKTFDKRAVTGAELLASYSDKVKALNIDLLEQQMKIKNVSDVIRDAYSIELKMLVNNLNAVGVHLLGAFGNEPKSFIDGLIQKIESLDNWVVKNRETIVGLASVMGNAAKAGLGLVGQLDQIAIGLGLVWGVAQLRSMGLFTLGFQLMPAVFAKATIGIRGFGVALNTALGPIGWINLALIALNSLLDTFLDRWNKAMDSQGINVATLMGTQTELDQLVKLRDAKIALTKAEKDLVDKKAAGFGTWKTESDNLKATKKDLLDLQKEYKNMYGDTAGLIVKDEKLVIDKLQNLLHKLHPNRKQPLTFDPVAVTEPTKDLVNNIIIPPDKPVDKELEKLNEEIKQIDKVTKLEKKYKKIVEDRKAKEKRDDEELESKAKDIAMGDTDTDASDAISKIKAKIEQEAAAKESIMTSTINIANDTFSIIDNLEEQKLNRTLARLDQEKAALDTRYKLEVAAAGDSTFKKQMAEEKYAQRKAELDKKEKAARDKAAKDEQRRALFIAGLNAIVAVTDVWAKEPAEFWGKAAAAAATLAIVSGLVVQATSMNFRSGGVVTGDGNGSSDSVRARLSVGERVLTHSDLGRLGGNDNVTQMIDRGSSYTTNSSVTIKIDTFVGTRQFARDVKDMLQRELKR